MAGKTRDDMAIRMDWQLTNWAIVYCGSLHLSCEAPPEATTPVLSEAERCEAALVIMRGTRARLYRALMLRYKRRWMDETACREMKCNARTYREIIYRGYAWLDGRLTH